MAQDVLNLLSDPIPLYTYLIHSGNDSVWPDRQEVVFARPYFISKTGWEKRIVHTFSPLDAELKRHIIHFFVSQSPSAFNNYLYSFAKQEEFFLLE